MKKPDKNFYSRLARGHPTAFEDVLNWHANDVLRLATFLLNDPDEARDVLQETMLNFVEAVKKRQVHMNNGSMKPLILTIARNLCINRLKRDKRLVAYTVERIENLPDMIDPQTPGCRTNEMEFEAAFTKALDRLSPLQKTIIVLHELNQDSFKEIAVSLNISYESVKKNFYRGLKKMRVLLEPFNR